MVETSHKIKRSPASTQSSTPKIPATISTTPKTKLLIGFSIALTIAIVSLISLVIFFNSQSSPTQTITKAITKILSPDRAKKIQSTGNIKITSTTPSTPFKSLQLQLSSSADLEKLSSSTHTIATLKTQKDRSVFFDFESMNSDEKSFFIKINHLSETIHDPSFQDIFIPADSKILTLFESVVKSIDNQWINLSISDLNTFIIDDKTATVDCITSKLKTLPSLYPTFSDILNRNNFINATPLSPNLTQNSTPLYQIDLLPEPLTNFFNTLIASAIADHFRPCNNEDESFTFNSKDISEITRQISNLTVAIDSNYNFSQLHLTLHTENAEITLDFDFTYPEQLNIDQPTDYLPVSQLFQKFF